MKKQVIQLVLRKKSKPTENQLVMSSFHLVTTDVNISDCNQCDRVRTQIMTNLNTASKRKRIDLGFVTSFKIYLL